MSIDRDMDHLHPFVRGKIAHILSECVVQGLPIRMFEGFRSKERQDQLYAQGRTGPGIIVTYAKGGESMHQYGLAADLVGWVSEQWTWELSEQVWHDMGVIARQVGLVQLDFERPHVELPGYSISSLQHGVLPPNGDASWAKALGLKSAPIYNEYLSGKS